VWKNEAFELWGSKLGSGICCLITLRTHFCFCAAATSACACWLPRHRLQQCARSCSQSTCMYHQLLQSSACVSGPSPSPLLLLAGREIEQPTVVDPVSFMVWKDEAFELWSIEQGPDTCCLIACVLACHSLLFCAAANSACLCQLMHQSLSQFCACMHPPSVAPPPPVAFCRP
jgi:hypothetical protein